VSEVSTLREWCKEEFGVYALQFLETEKINIIAEISKFLFR
jgi:hypothetical protein